MNKCCSHLLIVRFLYDSKSYFDLDSYIENLTDLLISSGISRKKMINFLDKFNYDEPTIEQFISFVNYVIKTFNIPNNKLSVIFTNCDNFGDEFVANNQNISSLKENVHKQLKTIVDRDEFREVDFSKETDIYSFLFAEVMKFNRISKKDLNNLCFRKFNKDSILILIKMYNKIYEEVFNEKCDKIVKINIEDDIKEIPMSEFYNFIVKEL